MNKTASLKIACLLIIAILSITIVSPLVSSPKFHASSIEVIDEKKLTVMAMSTAVTAASVAISAIPDDTGSSVADELDDLSSVLFIIVCILYLEKYMLTIFSSISFTALIPVACVFFSINELAQKENLRIWGTRLLTLALVLSLIVPVSVGFTKMLEDTFEESINQTFDSVMNIMEDDSSGDEDSNIFERFWDSIKDTVTGVIEAAKKMLSLFVDAVAVLVVTSCLVPIITAFTFVWLMKNIFHMPWDPIVLINTARSKLKRKKSEGEFSVHVEETDERIA